MAAIQRRRSVLGVQRMWRPGMYGMVASACLACAGGSEGHLSGTWDMSEQWSSPAGITCTVAGELILSHQPGSTRFGGLATRQGTCAGAPTGFQLGGADNVLNGRFHGTEVSFEVDLCPYRGTYSDAEMSGTLACTVGVVGQPTEFTGTWQATQRVY